MLVLFRILLIIMIFVIAVSSSSSSSLSLWSSLLSSITRVYFHPLPPPYQHSFSSFSWFSTFSAHQFLEYFFFQLLLLFVDTGSFACLLYIWATFYSVKNWGPDGSSGASDEDNDIFSDWHCSVYTVARQILLPRGRTKSVDWDSRPVLRGPVYLFLFDCFIRWLRTLSWFVSVKNFASCWTAQESFRIISFIVKTGRLAIFLRRRCCSWTGMNSGIYCQFDEDTDWVVVICCNAHRPWHRVGKLLSS